MVQKQSYKTYSKEFKKEVVALAHDQGYSVTDAEKSLGIASNMLYRWKQHI
ncbi:MAG: transposase [Gammaproteobacteria bacterium]|nr:transposase [Gammaproteobacteria bacterium]